MKAIKFMSLLMVAVLGFGSCSNDIPQYQPGNDQEDKNIGYLSLAGMQVSVMEDTEVVNSQTRAEGIDINTFDVKITNQAGDVVTEFKYGERPAEPIALEGGVYRISMMSAEMKRAEWEAPVYGAEKEVIITRQLTTEVKDIVCKLRNIKVSVSYAADIKEQLDPTYTSMTIALSNNELDYALNEERKIGRAHV